MRNSDLDDELRREQSLTRHLILANLEKLQEKVEKGEERYEKLNEKVDKNRIEIVVFKAKAATWSAAAAAIVSIAVTLLKELL